MLTNQQINETVDRLARKYCANSDGGDEAIESTALLALLVTNLIMNMNTLAANVELIARHLAEKAD
jgi:hypothetical protein